MFDVHHHLLFGLDDGSPDLETSLSMAEMAIEDGITHIVCTPHANSEYPYSPEQNAERLAQLRSKLQGRVTLGIGCDFHLSYDNIESALDHPSRYSINGGRYLLVEFPDFGIPRNIASSFHELQVAGLVPIITHPERNLTLMQQTERIHEWVEMGCLVQITAASVLGRFGKGPQRVARQLLDLQWVHMLATDAHNLTSRPPKMREAYAWIARKYGEVEAERLCVRNPGNVFKNLPLEEQPGPRQLGASQERAPGRRWFGLFGRRDEAAE
jgi:protein-tyrosine phosphatase